MGFFDRFRGGSAARAESGAAEKKPQKRADVIPLFNPNNFFSEGVKVDPSAQREGTKMIPKAEIEVARQQREVGPKTPEVEKQSVIGEAKQDVLQTYRTEIASWKPETVAAMDDFQERITIMEESLFDFCDEVLDAEEISASDKKDVEEVKEVFEKFLTMVEPFAEGGIGGKDIRVRADSLRQMFQKVEKRLG